MVHFKHMEKCDQFHTTQNIHRILKKKHKANETRLCLFQIIKFTAFKCC